MPELDAASTCSTRDARGVNLVEAASSGAVGWARGCYERVAELLDLEADIRAWAIAWNDNPRPFIWTTPAEQILDSIGRLLTRISGAEISGTGY